MVRLSTDYGWVDRRFPSARQVGFVCLGGETLMARPRISGREERGVWFVTNPGGDGADAAIRRTAIARRRDGRRPLSMRSTGDREREARRARSAPRRWLR